MRALTASLLVLALAVPAAAKSVEDTFAGKVMVSDKAYPTSSNSVSAYVKQIKKQSKKKFVENKEKQEWKIYYAAFFKKPVDDLAITMNIYDVSQKPARLVESYEQYLSERGQRVIIGKLNLPRTDTGYEANTKVRLDLEFNGKVIATSTFTIAGETKKYKGTVDFSEDEPAEGGEKKK